MAELLAGTLEDALLDMIIQVRLAGKGGSRRQGMATTGRNVRESNDLCSTPVQAFRPSQPSLGRRDVMMALDTTGE